MSNLSLGSAVANRETRKRYVRTYFPGALPFVVAPAIGGPPLSYHVSEKEALEALRDVVTWEEPTSGILLPVGEAPRVGWTIRYGQEDWPESETTNRVVLVGEMNPYQDRRDFDLYDSPEKASGYRLRELILGVSRTDYFRRFYRRNLCVGKWSLPAARRRAEELCVEFPTNTFVLLGKKVQSAFWCPDSADKISTLTVHNDRRVVLLPHPSGLCRVWNEPGAFEQARDLLRSSGVFVCSPGRSVG